MCNSTLFQQASKIFRQSRGRQGSALYYAGWNNDCIGGGFLVQLERNLLALDSSACLQTGVPRPRVNHLSIHNVTAVGFNVLVQLIISIQRFPIQYLGGEEGASSTKFIADETK